MSAHALVGGTLRELGVAAAEAIAKCAKHHTSEGDAEAIHDLRVALRRLRSALRPARELYGKKADRAEEQLKAALDLTSELRDEEVLRETLGELKVSAPTRAKLDAWMLGRARRERGLRSRTVKALADAIADRDGLPSALLALDERISRGPREDLPRGKFVHDVIAEAVRTIEERAATAELANVAAMHRVRISAKKLRYTAALLHGTPDGDAKEVKDAVELSPQAKQLAQIEKSGTRVQKRLGQLHDVDEALVRMHRAWGLDRAARSEVLTALAHERARLAVISEKELGNELFRIRDAVAAIDALDAAASATTAPETTPEAVTASSSTTDTPSNSGAQELS